uniref:LAGLIDADG endonuclease n=1 Tax=Trametes versicolor TaxID=5325 RepID=A0A7S8WV59_TRAVE|nr:LAGLIDADG endonuclease [Trametes versicolor]QPF23605.1 LAGLIDADG endonuclease [Trametes versicolor]
MKDVIQIMIFTILSLPIHLYISDNYNYSKNLFIRIIQKLIFNIIKFSFLIWLFSWLNIEIFNRIFCDTDTDTDNYKDQGKDKGKGKATDTDTDNNTNLDNPTEVEQNKNTSAEETNKGKEILKVSTNTYANSEEYYNVSVKKSTVDGAVSSIPENSVQIVKELLPNLGIAGVAGRVGTEIAKQTPGNAMVPRAGLIIAGTSAAAIWTALGLEAAKIISKVSNSVMSSETSNSKESPETSQTLSSSDTPQAIESSDTPQASTSSSPISEVTDTNDMLYNTTVDGNVSAENSNETSDDDETRSPTEGGFINSMLEDSEIPLIVLINSLHIINYFEFSLILGLFSLLFRKYFMNKLQKFILKFIYKKVDLTQDKSITLNKVFNYLEKYNEYVILYVFICLIWLKIIHVYISYNLAADIDTYVTLYNSVKHNSLFLIFSIKNNYKFYLNKPQWLNKDLKIKEFIPLRLNKMILSGQWIFILLIYSLVYPFIIISLFTFTISIWLNKWVVVSLLYNIQITSNFTEIDISDIMIISNIILPISPNKNKIKSLNISNINIAYYLNSPIFYQYRLTTLLIGKLK